MSRKYASTNDFYQFQGRRFCCFFFFLLKVSLYIYIKHNHQITSKPTTFSRDFYEAGINCTKMIPGVDALAYPKSPDSLRMTYKARASAFRPHQ